MIWALFEKFWDRCRKISENLRNIVRTKQFSALAFSIDSQEKAAQTKHPGLTCRFEVMYVKKNCANFVRNTFVNK